MPLYEYYCDECNGVFELLRPVREASDPQPCPVCDSDSRRLMPTDFAAFVVRDGMPRRIPDQGLFWGVEGQLKNPLTSSEAKPQDIIDYKHKRPDSAILTEDEKVAPKKQIRVRAKRKPAATKVAAAAKPASKPPARRATAGR